MSEPRRRSAADPARPVDPSAPARGKPPPGSPAEPPERPGNGRIVRTATEARQGEIILGRYGRWVWIGAFAAIVILILIFGF